MALFQKLAPPKVARKGEAVCQAEQRHFNSTVQTSIQSWQIGNDSGRMATSLSPQRGPISQLGIHHGGHVLYIPLKCQIEMYDNFAVLYVHKQMLRFL